MLVAVLAQQSTETLNVLPHAARTGKDNADAGGRHIHAFVEHLAGHDDGIFAAMKTQQDLPAFLRFGLMRDGRDEEAAPIW